MNPKEIKQALKEIRELIKNKEIKSAIQKCQDVLTSEPENYMALVLMGAAYQEKDKTEAAKYLRKALLCSEDSTLALQGLANCADTTELPEIYRKLLKLMPDKSIEYHKKIVSASCKKENLDACIQILISETKIENATGKNSDRISSALISLTPLLLRKEELTEDEENLFMKSLRIALIDPQLENRIDCYKRFLKLSYKRKELEQLLSFACAMNLEYPNEVYPLEWICKIYCENYDKLNFENLLLENIDIYVAKLLNLNKSSSLGLFVQAIKFYNANDYVVTRNLLLQVKNIQPNLMSALKLLMDVYMKLGAYELAANVHNKVHCDDIKYALCLSYTSKNELELKEAFKLLQESLAKATFDESKIDTICGVIRCLYKTKSENNSPEEYLKDLRKLGKEDLAANLEAEHVESPEKSLEILKDFSDDICFEVALQRGKKLFILKQYDKALQSLLKATRLKPYFSECFLCLGDLYTATKDESRARKCLEKCVALNAINEKAVHHLSAIYRKNTEFDSNYTLLQTTLNYVEGAQSKWVLFLLSLHYLSVKSYDDAINSLRSVLRYDESNILYWETLADAYFQRGSYISALKVYQKLLDLDPENLYAKYQVCNSKTILRMYTEAIQGFDDLLASNADYLPALKGVAEAHYGLANQLIVQRLIGRSKDHLQAAVKHLQKAFTVGKRDMVWLWRMIANIFVMVANLPSSKAFLNVSGKLAGRKESTINLGRKQLLEFAARFYTCAIKLHPEDTYLWHELSLCYYHFAHFCDNENEKNNYMKFALSATHRSIEVEPLRWQNWNLLGVIYSSKEIKNFPAAQHCFIKALQIEKKTSILWTNLGALYLNLGSIKLANQAFQKAQQANPNFVNAWAGQAQIAEMIGEEEEAMDLYRHCTQLEFHPESALGYGHWVSLILSNTEKLKEPRYQYAIEKMFALPVALDSMNWYINEEDDRTSIEAFTYYGFLTSKCSLWRPCIRAFTAALRTTKTSQERDKLFCNLGYSLLKVGEPQEAITAFNSIQEATLRSTIGLAVAHLQAGQAQEAYSVYTSALEWLADSEEEKSIILAAMSPIVYAAQGENDTKTILFQCIALANAPIEGLFATCALGIVHKDYQLAETILEELRKFEDDAAHCHHIAFLTGQYYRAIGEIRKGVVHLLQRIHMYPARADLRKILAEYLLQNSKYLERVKRHLSAASQIAEGALILELKNPERKNCLEAAKLMVVASEAMRRVNKVKRTKLAQRAVHIHPECREAWNILNDCKE